MIRLLLLLASLLWISTYVPSLSATSTPSTAVEVFYLVNNNTVTTYDVNRRNGEAGQTGSAVTIAAATSIGPLTPTPDGHFVYVLWTDAERNAHLWAYETNASGVPVKVVQKLSVPRLAQFEVDPNGMYAYGLVSWTDSIGQMWSNIRLFYIDESTGRLSESSAVQATYGPNYYYSASLDGFNRKGSKLYDVWSFSFDHESAAVYSYHPVATNGMLRSDVKIFSTSDFDSLDVVDISDKLLSETFGSIFDSWVNVYSNPPQYSSDQPVPLIHCTASMLAICGNAEGALFDLRGQNLFLTPLTTGDTVVAHIDLAQHTLVEGGVIPGFASITLSPDPELFYAVNWAYNADSTITVYHLDPTNGRLIQGGQVVAMGQGLYASRRTQSAQ